jgi:hypothetical protein
MAQYSNEQANEHVLSVLPDNLLIYCIDKFEPSCLFGTLDVNLKKLFLENQLRYYCPWLPDDVELLNSIDFLHYNNGIKITAGTEPFYDTIAKTNLKPAVVYKQEGKKLKIQSVIGESKNFHLDDKITFYLFNSSDPGQIIDTINLNSSDLNNFNLFEINLNTTTPVKLISNYSHLHIEEQHANTDYQF